MYAIPRPLFPTDRLRKESAARTRQDPEFELIDTGIFDHDEYFDVFVEYAKASQEDLLMQITIFNRGPKDAPLTVLPTACSVQYLVVGVRPVQAPLSGRRKSRRGPAQRFRGAALPIHRPARGMAVLRK